MADSDDDDDDVGAGESGAARKSTLGGLTTGIVLRLLALGVLVAHDQLRPSIADNTALAARLVRILARTGCIVAVGGFALAVAFTGFGGLRCWARPPCSSASRLSLTRSGSGSLSNSHRPSSEGTFRVDTPAITPIHAVD